MNWYSFKKKFMWGKNGWDERKLIFLVDIYYDCLFNQYWPIVIVGFSH
jgi:hypothetical protein